MKSQPSMARLSTLLLAVTSSVNAIQLTLTDQGNVKSVMSSLAYDMMTFYHGNESGQTPGLLPGPCASPQCYYWWEAGAMFGSLINYWQYTGDSSYNGVVSQALQFQRGERNNFNPANQSSDMGNDDQAFWAFSAMDAAESNFPAPPEGDPSWLSLADAVFNFQAGEWDAATCGGGIRWQVYQFGDGYNLKNSISDGGFFQLAARLARYTGNQTYADWANKMYDWMAQSKLMSNDGKTLTVWDNTDTNNNCSDVDHYLWTYNAGTMIMGAAYMYDFTNQSAVWQQRISLLLAGATSVYFPTSYASQTLSGNIMAEVECEAQSNCNNDQSSFKAYLSRWMAVTAYLAPFTKDTIMPKLQASAQGAAAQCSGGANGRMCGRRWYTSTYDGTSGVGQQMSALSVIGANLMSQSLLPLSTQTGAKSATNASSENVGVDSSNPVVLKPITTADKAGAAILTILACMATAAACMFMVLD